MASRSVMPRKNVLPFLLPFWFPLLVLVGLYFHQSWTFRSITWVYLAGPFLDLLLGRNSLEIAENHEPSAWRFLLWMWLPLHVAVLLAGITTALRGGPGGSSNWLWLLTLATNVGMAGGMFAVTVAHEFLHGGHKLEHRLAAMLLTLLHYPQFCVEHIHGHHKRVATSADPATARLGESLYGFYLRCIPGSFLSAWDTETARLRAAGRSPWSFRNIILRCATGLSLLYVLIARIFGWRGVVFFAVQGIVAIAIIEAINYVGHYGLVRHKISPGLYESVSTSHAWNSNYRFTNWVLFNVARHSDHHYEAARSCLALRHRPEAPQLPAGYFAMFVLALFPPLWRKIMDPLAIYWRSKTSYATTQVSS